MNGTVRIGARLRQAREAGRLSLADVEARIEVVLEDETYALGPGDALTFGAAVAHTWRATGAARILAPGLPDPRNEVN